ncbi:acVLRF1 family peptidyl-tRNA hydrolase [Actinocrinis sp.]|uniref:acVLRF1 family peptidyl-tRNA hydrolase n=1 Tax=Actinocrinis sp. TaxID=1920516 RepID=UPI002D67FF5F|nr:acVLRF1 family peptidyl-tRNA hydrolase [Actinocrinis sp.]HZP53613.1 acVLRF1 family peptidyl-tRNA hydrolase [Actinocrinis sp.]
MVSRPAAGGGVWVEVGPDRLVRWCDGFAQRHGGALAEPPRVVAADDACSGQAVELTAVDGSRATCCVPFPPLDAAESVGLIDDLAAHALAPRTVGVLLVRRGGYAVGLFEGTRLTDSKVGARHVQGRTKAGGWSQQRFARRREGQAREAYTAAADTAARILLPHTARLDALIVGGDTGALGALRSDARLKPLWEKELAPQLYVGDPKMADLQKAPDHFRAIRIRIVEQS